MNRNGKTILNCLGVAIIALITVNLITLGVEVSSLGLSNISSIGFDNGAFSLNGQISGLEFGGAKAGFFMAMIFMVALVRKYFSGDLSLTSG